MKLGISLKIDVTKIEKERLFAAQSGAKYLDLTTFVDLDNPGQYGDHGFISQNVSKQEREQGVKGPILGNAKVFYTEGGQQGGFSQPQQQPHPNQSGGMAPPQQAQGSQKYGQGGPQAPQQAPQGGMNFDDDIPFAPIGLQHRALLSCI